MTYSNNLYEVKSGDNLWKICKKEFGLTSNQEIAEKVNEIAKRNNISPDSIWVGQKLDLSGVAVSNENDSLTSSAPAVDNSNESVWTAKQDKTNKEYVLPSADSFISYNVSNDAHINTQIAPNGLVTKVYSNLEIDKIIEKEAQAHNLDSTLVQAIIATESNHGQFAKNKWSGAAGLMQLMPRTASSLGCENPYDAKENIKAGVKHFARLLKLYDGNVDYAICAYNAGEGNFNKYLRGEKKLPRETVKYLPKVKQNYINYGGESIS